MMVFTARLPISRRGAGRPWLLGNVLLALIVASACRQGMSSAATAFPSPTPTLLETTVNSPLVLSLSLTPTPTDKPDFTLTPTPTPSDPPTSVYATNAQLVNSGEAGVILRHTPGTAGDGVLILRGNAPLTLVGRSDDNTWLQVTLVSGIVGWLPVANVQTDLDINTLAITGAVQDYTPTPVPEAVVRADADGLRLRDAPGLTTQVITQLNGQTFLDVLGRTADDRWLQVQLPDGIIGWVATEYVDLSITRADLPITGVEVVGPPTPVPAPTYMVPPEWTGVITNISDHAREIFLRGQSLGNRANVFSKVGDSITVAAQMYYPIGQGRYHLGQYGYLQPVIDYFSAEIARDGNSFANVSLAADNGWTTASVLNPELANYPVIWDPQCLPGEFPLICEYRVTRPAIALIMLGTNDVALLPLEEYRTNLDRIVQITIDHGIIPVLSTIPERPGYDVAPYNQMIRSIAGAHDIPLWDYWSAMIPAPHYGISEDDIHPSVVPGALRQSVVFSRNNLQYGYTIRNLTALIVLDAIWRQVIQVD